MTADAAWPDLAAALDLPRVPRQARGRRKRDAILAAAEALFAERGYEAVAIEDLVARAGVSVGTFYGYFRNKRQVLLSLIGAQVEGLLGLGLAGLDFGDEPRAAIARTVREALGTIARGRGLRRAWLELLPRDPELAARQREVGELVRGQVAGAIEAARARGLTWPQLDAPATAWAIVLLFEQVAAQAALGAPAPVADERLAAALTDLIHRAVFRQAAGEDPAAGHVDHPAGRNA
jgi:AcrR family transcriptional regulator